MKIRLMFASAIVLAAAHLPGLAQSAPADLVAAYRAALPPKAIGPRQAHVLRQVQLQK